MMQRSHAQKCVQETQSQLFFPLESFNRPYQLEIPQGKRGGKKTKVEIKFYNCKCCRCKMSNQFTTAAPALCKVFLSTPPSWLNGSSEAKHLHNQSGRNHGLTSHLPETPQSQEGVKKPRCGEAGASAAREDVFFSSLF